MSVVSGVNSEFGSIQISNTTNFTPDLSQFSGRDVFHFRLKLRTQFKQKLEFILNCVKKYNNYMIVHICK